MADGFSVDTSELRRLEVDMGRAPAAVVAEGEKVLEHGAFKLKGALIGAFSESDYFGQVAPAVSYDRLGMVDGFGYEVGPTIGGAGGAGSLAGIAVDGGANGGGGTVDIDHLLEPEAVKVERFLGDILEGLL